MDFFVMVKRRFEDRETEPLYYYNMSRIILYERCRRRYAQYLRLFFYLFINFSHFIRKKKYNNNTQAYLPEPD